ncbi:MAG: hypothetical protein KDK11_04080 [Maritimibacter sp.]|nr:hypothetical protein [Maritimibacter sp.]
MPDPLVPKLTPPYSVAIFCLRPGADESALQRRAGEFLRIAARSEAFLGGERARSADGNGVAVFYWRTRDALEDWLRTSYRSAALTDPDDETGPVGYDYLLRIADVGAEYSAAECDRAFGARR